MDRITILEIKVERLAVGRADAEEELRTLVAAWTCSDHPSLDDLAQTAELRRVNRRLWDVEDALRALETMGRFDEEFVALARSVYTLNDERARLKRGISEAVGSRLVERKGYSTGLPR